jgi:outer membrane protein OmpA-like peptidoglycan-associated protein
MSRRGAVTVTAVLVATAVVVGGGLYVRSLRVAPGGGSAPVRASIIRSSDATVYNAPDGILFATASADLTPGAVPALQDIVADVRRSGLAGPIQVEGYTDDVGSEYANLALSRARAQTVADWLVREGGVPGSRIVVVGKGETSPAQPNDTELHRAANRRVVIVVSR